MSALAQRLPQPPPILANLNPAEIPEERLPHLAEIEGELVKYARALLKALEAVISDAREGSLDLEKLLWEIRQKETEKLRESRQSEKSVRRWAKEIARLYPLLKTPLKRNQGRELIRLGEERKRHAQVIWDVTREVYEAFQQCRKTLTELRTGHLQAYRPKFEAFLASLPDSEASSQMARSLWRSLAPKLPAPECSVSDEGVLLVWDNGPHHLQVECFHAGTIDWFYRNRETEAMEGQEGLNTGELPLRFHKLVKEFRAWP